MPRGKLLLLQRHSSSMSGAVPGRPPCRLVDFIGFGYIKPSFVLIINAYEGTIMCPTELRTQCVHNWESAVKLPS
jgi:hypothetical protein